MGKQSLFPLGRQSFAALVALVILVASFQNCSKISFFSSAPTEDSQADSFHLSSGGEVYDGKLTFLQIVPGFECEKQVAPKSILRRNIEGSWRLTTNEREKCGAIENQIVTDVAYSAGDIFLNYHDVLYYLDNLAPEVPTTLVGHIREFLVKPGVDANSADATPGDGVCANLQGDCSLQSAVQEGNAFSGAKIIIVPAGIYNLNTRLVFGGSSLAALVGESAQSTSIVGGSAQGLIASSQFFSSPFSTFVLQNLSINGGNSNDPFGASGLNITGSAHVKDCIFENHAGIAATIYAGVSSRSVLIENTRVRGNLNTAIGVFGPNSLIVRNSEIINNSGYGVDVSNGTYHVEILGSTIANNGAGILYRKCYRDCLIENSTISGNSRYGFSLASSPMGEIKNTRIRNTTISNNGLVAGSNILVNVPLATSEFLLFENTIVSRGSSPMANCEINSSTTSYSLKGISSMIDDSSCGTSEFLIADPQLLPLANTGGFSMTHGLSPTSPAIDAGTNSSCSIGDQRGFPRPVQKVGAAAICDLGSVEEQ